MKDTCKQAMFRKDIRKSQENCRSLESGDQDKRELEFFQQEEPINEYENDTEDDNSLEKMKKSSKRI